MSYMPMVAATRGTLSTTAEASPTTAAMMSTLGTAAARASASWRSRPAESRAYVVVCKVGQRMGVEGWRGGGPNQGRRDKQEQIAGQKVCGIGDAETPCARMPDTLQHNPPPPHRL